MMQGKLIVMEGIDGSGKSTQFARLCERLTAEGLPFHRIVFPRYSEPSSALLTMYLKGEFGSRPADVNAYAASVFYAVDRFASFRMDWKSFYENGGLVLADRYATSNAVHQGAKLPESERPAFLDWLRDLEYVKMELPEPDLVLYMDIDLKTALAQMSERNGGGDIHENDAEYLQSCLSAGASAAEHYGWRRIACLKNGKMRGIDEIHEDVFNTIKGVL